MKKIIVIILAAMMLLSACGQASSQSGDKGGQGSLPDPQSATSGQSQFDASQFTEEQALGYELVAHYMDAAAYNKLITDYFGVQIPNNAMVSPDSSKLLMWYEEFEEAAPWYLYDIGSGAVEVIPVERQPQSSQLKDAAWCGNGSIIMIIGNLYGTVAVGGDIYRYDMVGDPYKIYANPEREQTVSVAVRDEKTLLIETAQFDENMNNYEAVSGEKPLVSSAMMVYEERWENDVMGVIESCAVCSWSRPMEVYDFDDSGEVTYVIPKYVGSSVTIKTAEYVESTGELRPVDTVASYTDTSDAFVLRLGAMVPEGMPLLFVIIEHGEMRSSFALGYDGRGESTYRLMRWD